MPNLQHVALWLCLLALAPTMAPTMARASDCDSPDAAWLMCEDFEGGGAGWDAWWATTPFVECLGCSGGTNNPDRILLTSDPAYVFDGTYALRMPAEAGAGYRGADLVYRSCAGAKRPGCALENHDVLYFRARVRLDADHRYVHHFLSIGGSRADAYWESYGNAGCRPNGYRHAGTTVDFNADRELFFYTYTPDMRCDSGGYCSGSYVADICAGCATKDMACGATQECCWGNLYSATPRPVLPRGEWVCVEMMMQLNTPGRSDGEMAFWLNDVLEHRETGMRFRDVPELGLNQARLQHYIAGGDATQSNRVSFDDVIVSTARIGCGRAPTPGDAGVGADAGPTPRDAGGLDAGATPRDAGRARMDAASPRPDSGRPLADASGAGLDAAPDAVSMKGGCACRAGPAPRGGPSALLLLPLIAWALRARRA